jgi:hypothetical protein
METANPILGNPLLLVAILLFLAILPRALRQKRKTTLDKMVERFEKKELQTDDEEEHDKNDPEYEQTARPKDKSLAYLIDEIPTSQTQENETIPPFPVEEEPEKIIKEGIPIPHNEAEDTQPAPKRKVKLIKQEISTTPGENQVSPKKTPSESLKEKKSATPTEEQRPTREEDFKASLLSELEAKESENNWIESEIPGLIMEPIPTEVVSESIPTFKAFPKAKYQTETESPSQPSQKEKEGPKVKNIAPKSEGKKDSNPKKQVKIKSEPPALEVEISESTTKPVEKKASVVSHKSIAKKKRKRAKTPASNTGELHREEKETSSEKVKPKPFLLDLKYLDREESEAIDKGKLPADMVDVVVARLNALQVDLENQFTSVSEELTPGDSQVNGSMWKSLIQGSFPALEEVNDESPDRKEVSLEKLDSFLFTTTQRKNRE